MPLSRLSITAAVCLAFSTPALAQTNGQSSLTVTGYAQAQYERIDLTARTRDRVFFRRLYLGVRFVISDDWAGVVMIDFTRAAEGDHPIVRDAYVRYSGWARRGLTLTIGNQKTPFSQSVLGSSRSRSLIERPFTGERAYGATGRAIAVQADGRHYDQRVQWSMSLASVLHAPLIAEVRLDGLADSNDTWNEGAQVTGRIEWHPRGPVVREQGDFTRGKFRVMAGTAAYTWTNDGDRNLFTDAGVSTSATLADLDHAHAVEVSGALRGHGLAIDAAWSQVSADTIDPHFTGGLYLDGHTTLQQFGAEGGFMIVPSRLEILAAIDALATDARESTTYRPAVGTTWYMNGHRMKLSAQHRETINPLGVPGARSRVTYAQMQFAF